SASPSGCTSKSETVLSPELTAKSCRPLPLRITAPCEPSAAPEPRPPVANVPCGVSEPSAAREKASTALPAAELVRVYTAPGLEELIEVRRAAGADRKVALEALDLRPGKRSLEVVGHELHELLAGESVGHVK